MKVWKENRIIIYRLLSFFLSFYLLFVTSVNSYASTTGSGAASDWSGAQIADWVTNNLMWICAEGFDFVAQDTILQGVGTKVASKIESLVHDNPEYTSYDSWWERHFGFNPSPNTTPNYDKPIDQNSISNVYWDQSVTNVFNEAIQETVAENPLTYTECYISSYNFLNTDQFGNQQLFSSVKEVLKQNNGYSFFLSSSGPNASIKNMYLVTVDKSKYPVNFIGTTTQGSFTNVTLEHNWGTINSFPENIDGVDIRFFQLPNGTLGAPAKTYREAASNAGYNSTWVPSISTVKNTSSAFVSSGGNAQTNVFTNLPKNELVYVFSTLNAYKNYNSGSPQPYYFGSGYGTTTGSVNLNTSNMSNSGNYYSNVVNNVQSGWTAEQVLELVDKVINTGGGSGSGGSGSGSSDNPFSFLGTIGEAVGKLVGGIGDFIAQVVGGIVDAILDLINMFVGEDGILNKLTSLINTGFNTFLGDMFSWLPSEVVTCFTACLLVGIFFAIWKIIRG